MKSSEKILYESQIEHYLQTQQIPFLVQSLMKSLVLSQPDDPINFLISSLQKPPNNKIFLTGCPGYKSGGNKIAEEISS
jgi:adenylate kinase